MIAELRRVAPAQHQELIVDFFETITLYDDRATSAQARKRADGKYELDLVVTVRKTRADGAGNEQDAPLDAEMDIGVYDATGNVLLLEKRRVRTGENRFRLAVDGEPARAGIDPLNKMIDRDSGDNMMKVSVE